MRRSNRFMSAQYCGTSFVQPQRVIGAPWSFPPEPWWKRKGQTKAPTSQWLFRWPLGPGHCTDSLLAMQGVSPALFAAPFFKPLTYEVSRMTSWLLLLHRRSPSHQPVA